MSEKAENAYKAVTRLCMRLEKLQEQALEVGHEAGETRRSLIVLRDEIREGHGPDSDPARVAKGRRRIEVGGLWVEQVG